MISPAVAALRSLASALAEAPTFTDGLPDRALVEALVHTAVAGVPATGVHATLAYDDDATRAAGVPVIVTVSVAAEVPDARARGLAVIGVLRFLAGAAGLATRVLDGSHLALGVPTGGAAPRWLDGVIARGELERSLAEHRAAQAHLVQQAKMASLGQLVAGVAHEINTPLGAILSNEELFERCFARLRAHVAAAGLGEDPVVARDLAAVEELTAVTRLAGARMAEIVRELRTFARLDEAERKVADLHEGLESTLRLIQHLLRGGITVARRYGALPPVECHPGQVNQVFMNLLVNACHAMPGGGTLTIESATIGDRARIAIRDTGTGIAPEHLARIFDPGFTTKGVGVGTGLGLSICWQIVASHGGEITVESTPGQGTTFVVWLPIAWQGG